MLGEMLRESVWHGMGTVRTVSRLCDGAVVATVMFGMLFASMLLLRSRLRGKLGSQMIYALWALPALRLLLPLEVENPLFRGMDPFAALGEGLRKAAYACARQGIDAINAVRQFLSGGTLAEEALFTFRIAALARMLAVAYLTGAAGVALWMLAGNLRFRRSLRRRDVGPVSRETEEAYWNICREMELKPLPVRLCDPLESPCLAGVFRRVIYLPLNMDAAQTRYALLHEMAHARHYDTLLMLLRNALCVVFFFNPLVWIAARMIREDCELSCDALAAQYLTKLERVDYAQMLISSSSRARREPYLAVTTGLTMDARALTRRLKSVITDMRPCRSVQAVVLAGGILLTAFAFATLQAPERAARPEEKQSVAQAFFEQGLGLHGGETVEASRTEERNTHLYQRPDGQKMAGVNVGHTGETVGFARADASFSLYGKEKGLREITAWNGGDERALIEEAVRLVEGFMQDGEHVRRADARLAAPRIWTYDARKVTYVYVPCGKQEERDGSLIDPVAYEVAMNVESGEAMAVRRWSGLDVGWIQTPDTTLESTKKTGSLLKMVQNLMADTLGWTERTMKRRSNIGIRTGCAAIPACCGSIYAIWKRRKG